ncbi:MAG: DoxX family protein [Vicinamibacteria bacterium]
MKKAGPMKGSFSTDAALLTLRLSGLGLSLAHGWPKIQRFLAGESAPFIEGVASLGFPYPFFFAWAAAITELVGGFAIALGLLTRVAAGFAAFTMAVAAFLRHRLAEHTLAFFGLMSVPEDVLESWGSPERAALYLLIFLALVLLGAGRFSLDRLVRRS